MKKVNLKVVGPAVILIGSLVALALHANAAGPQYRITYRAYTLTAPVVHEYARGVPGLTEIEPLNPPEWGSLDPSAPLSEDAQESDEGILAQLQAGFPEATFDLIAKDVETCGDGQAIQFSPWQDEGYTLTCSVKVSAGQNGKVLVGTHYEGHSPWLSGRCNDINMQLARDPHVAYPGVWTYSISRQHAGPTRFIQLITVTPEEA